ncbi:hypothetical protein Glove_208g60 [Diversispora epigaea]|uniref:Uncharacterized protein n=1 Tax=Diversispora epigaea TaxID=1348612 RepID=A0A397IT70_9GLOM|nr:hypothetical protein Glove_208g60 [Diversispora epigaea]
MEPIPMDVIYNEERQARFFVTARHQFELTKRNDSNLNNLDIKQGTYKKKCQEKQVNFVEKILKRKDEKHGSGIKIRKKDQKVYCFFGPPGAEKTLVVWMVFINFRSGIRTNRVIGDIRNIAGQVGGLTKS